MDNENNINQRQYNISTTNDNNIEVFDYCDHNGLSITENFNMFPKLKYLTCMDWIEVLKFLMKDVLDAMNELHHKACQRIDLLEEEIKTRHKIINHTSEVGKLKHDLNNLLKFIRRAREEQKWDTYGLEFLTISDKDIFGQLNSDYLASINDIKKSESELIAYESELNKLRYKNCILQNELDEKESQIKSYIKKIKELENITKKV